MKGLSVILPAYNEVRTLSRVAWEIAGAATLPYELLIVDDGSTDGTAVVADYLARIMPGVRAFHQPRNLGIGAAYRRALAEATLDHVVFLPADGEIAPASIRALFAAVGTADLVVTYHANPEARPWHRRLLTWGSTALVNRLFGFRLRYYQGPCIYSTALARRLPTTAGGFYFLTQMLVHALAEGHTYIEVGLVHQERRAGTSRAVSLPNCLRALRTIGAARWQVRRP